jgi:four helix bundle protein
MGPKSVSTLVIWQEGMAIVRDIYQVSGVWPRREIYGLTAQVRAAAVSVPANIAEGVGRGTSRETAHFARVALGSLYELDTLLQIAHELGFPTPDQVDLRRRISILARRISSFIAYKKTRGPHRPQPTSHNP